MFSESQQKLIDLAKSSGLEYKKLENPAYNHCLMHEILYGLQRNIDITPHINEKTSFLKARFIYIALSNGVDSENLKDVKSFLHMKFITDIAQNGLSINPKIFDSSLKLSDLINYRNNLFNEETRDEADSLLEQTIALRNEEKSQTQEDELEL